ncbi:MAG TPA: ankyrin repeat domain-containing protein [Actinomycetota bacterium]|nr:ankyrin repeat domain-containing protein [Actinomycetota bacterium]
MEKPPALEPALVQEFVVAGHADLDRTQVLLEEVPGLINAAWDWGGGDWETALGGASHMGRKDIAEYLLSKGARLDLFAAALLGLARVIRAAIDANPDVVNALGPHGIPLMTHAELGGNKEVIQLLS